MAQKSRNRHRAPLGVISRIWDYVEEPKNVTLVQALVVYSAAVWGGIMSLIHPPRTTPVILGDGLLKPRVTM